MLFEERFDARCAKFFGSFNRGVQLIRRYIEVDMEAVLTSSGFGNLLKQDPRAP